MLAKKANVIKASVLNFSHGREGTLLYSPFYKRVIKQCPCLTVNMWANRPSA